MPCSVRCQRRASTLPAFLRYSLLLRWPRLRLLQRAQLHEQVKPLKPAQVHALLLLEHQRATRK